MGGTIIIRIRIIHKKINYYKKKKKQIYKKKMFLMYSEKLQATIRLQINNFIKQLYKIYYYKTIFSPCYK